MFASNIERDVEESLRQFAVQNTEMSSIKTIEQNLANLAKDLEVAQKDSDKLAKKGGKASAAKVDAAQEKLSSRSADWEAQAPFIFEKLQGIDESRLNHLRDVLTQLGTHETDQIERDRTTVETTLNTFLEIDTSVEIHNFAANHTGGNPIERRPPPRQGSTVSTSARSAVSNHSSNLAPPPPPQMRPSLEDTVSQHSGRNEGSFHDKKESGLKRFGTMLGRRRQSIQHASSFGKSKDHDFASLGPAPPSREGRPVPSPRPSNNNLRGTNRTDNSLGGIDELPAAERRASASTDLPNGHEVDTAEDRRRRMIQSQNENHGREIKTPPGPPPPRKHGSHHESNAQPAAPRRQDSEGFSVPAAYNDPIAQAQAEAAEANDSVPAFKLNIKPEAIQEEDDQAQAALSTVANTLRSSNVLAPQRAVGTVRGRREIRNTMYIPAGDHPTPEAAPRSAEAPASMQTQNMNQSPSAQSPVSSNGNRAAALASLLGYQSANSQGTPTDRVKSSGDSVRSGTCTAVFQGAVPHSEMKEPGLNSSMIEKVSVSFVNSKIAHKWKVEGEVAMQWNDDGKPMPSEYIYSECGYLQHTDVFIEEHCVRIKDHADAIEVFSKANDHVTHNDGHPGQYIVALPSPHTRQTCFKYTARVCEGKPAVDNSFLPVLVSLDWADRGNDLGVRWNYYLNPDFSSSPVKFNNLTLVLRYNGPTATRVQTKPVGEHIRREKRIYFKLGEVALVPGEMHRHIALLIGGEGAVCKPGHLDVLFELEGRGSGLVLERKVKEGEIDPFDESDELVGEAWDEVVAKRKLVAGDYDVAVEEAHRVVGGNMPQSPSSASFLTAQMTGQSSQRGD